MTSILDLVKKEHERFVPRDRTEFLALQLARRLNDLVAVDHYITLCARYPEALLTSAFREFHPVPHDKLPAAAFEDVVKQTAFHGAFAQPPILGIKIERRRIGVVLLAQGAVHFQEALELSSDGEKATKSVRALIQRTIPRIIRATAAIERVEIAGDSRRRDLSVAVQEILRAHGISIWELDRANLFLATGIPAPRTLEELRATASGLLPTVDEPGVRGELLLDAGLAALYVDVERQLDVRSGGGR